MKYRISIWATAGFFVACFWVFYSFTTAMTSSDPMVPLLKFTCPIMFLGFHQLPFYLFFLANAVTYLSVGMILEMLRTLANHAS